jgi:sulfur carrier protein ThiS
MQLNFNKESTDLGSLQKVEDLVKKYDFPETLQDWLAPEYFIFARC